MNAHDRSLDRLIEEARAEVPPSVDWDGVEASLMKRAAEVPRPKSVAPRGVLLAAAAVLLAAGGFVALRTSVVDRAVVHAPVAEARTEQAEHRVNGDELAPGAVVTSGGEEVVVEHKGHVTWTLAPESTAHIESVGEVVALALDRGTVSAQVVKSPRPESFVVRVERTRVAVHGTRFAVIRGSDSVHVEVREGIVGVGPVVHRGFELPAPESATVTFDGVRTDIAAPSAAKARPTPAASMSGPTASVAHPKVSAAPQEGAIAPVEADGLPRGTLAGIDRVTTSVERCLREHTVLGEDLRVTVETRLVLHVDAKGTVGQALFAPPLAPAVGICVDAALETIRFPRSTDGFVIDRVLELNR